MVPDNTDNTTVEKFYRDLFNVQGYQDFINCDNQCYRQLLLLHCEITSDICKMCTNYRKNHAMSDAAIQARAAQDHIVSNKEYVREQLKRMSTHASHQHVMDYCYMCEW